MVKQCASVHYHSPTSDYMKYVITNTTPRISI